MLRYGSLIDINPSGLSRWLRRQQKSHLNSITDKLKEVNHASLFCIFELTHQAPAYRWSLVSHIVSVRTYVYTSVQKIKTRYYNVKQTTRLRHMGPGGSLNSQKLFFFTFKGLFFSMQIHSKPLALKIHSFVCYESTDRSYITSRLSDQNTASFFTG